MNPQPKLPPAPNDGLVGKVDADKSKIYLKSEEVILINDNDLILLDGAVCQLDALKPNDHLEVQYFDGPEGKTKRIQATRRESSHYVNRITNVDIAANRLSVSSDDEEDRKFIFDGETPVSLNGKSVVVAQLQVGDTVDVQYWSDEEGAHAVALDAKRQLKTSGVVDSFDRGQQTHHFLQRRHGDDHANGRQLCHYH